MPVPNHRPGCRTSIWPTSCPDCGDRIFYFSCSCGSKVFFDLDEPPWHPHEERCIPYLVRYLLTAEHRSVPDIREAVETFAFDRGLEVPSAVYDYLQRADTSSHAPPLVRRQVPRNNEVDVFGTIMEVNPGVNFLKRFDLPNNSLGRGLLGRLLDEPYIEAKLRTDPNSAGVVEEYVFFASQRMLGENSLGRGLLVFVTLGPLSLPGRTTYWAARAVRFGD